MLSNLLRGYMLVLATWMGAYQLGWITALGPTRLFNVNEHWLGCWVAVVGGLLYRSPRIRKYTHWVAGVVAAFFSLVCFTPLVEYPVRTWLYQTPDRPSDALVVLSAGSTAQGAMDNSGLNRLTSALLELSDHMPAALVITELSKSTDADIRLDQKRLIGEFTAHWYPPLTHYAVGPVASTFDEATKVKILAQKQHWKTITLVTSPMHMRRAAATFRKVGLDVVARPALERGFSIPQLETPGDRLLAYRELTTEIGAYLLYKLSGRL